MQLLFVPVTGEKGDLVDKERQYAACKAHTTRNAHKKRRLQLGTAQSLCTFRDTAPYPTSLVPYPSICDNGDLFDCHMIPRTPLLDEIVSSVQFYHRASWSPMNEAWLRYDTLHQRRFPGDVVPIRKAVPEGLWDIFTGSAGTFLSVVASIIPVIRPTISVEDAIELERVGLHLKAQSLVRLRQAIRVVQSNSTPSLALIYHVKALFREASMSGDLEGANVHAKMLVWLAEKIPAARWSAINLRRIALWGDAIPALLQLRRPIIDYQGWMPQLVLGIWNSAEPTLPHEKLPSESLPSCIRSPSLRAAFTHGRRGIDVQQSFRHGRLRCTEQIFQWLITKAEYHICSLLNLYLDLSEMKMGTELTEGEQHIEAALALALLHVYQKRFGSITRADGVDLHESAGIVYPALVMRVQSALTCASPSEQHRYQEAYLWLLFIGSSCEEQYGLPEMAGPDPLEHGGESSPSKYFRRQLVEEAHRLGLKSSNDVELHLGRLLPCGGLPLWFDKCFEWDGIF